MHRKPAVSLQPGMETRPQPTGSTWPEDEIRPFLSVCERYLRRGDYTACRDIAVKAQISNPNHPGPVQILAICSILAASSAAARPDWYSILHLPEFEEDETAIKKNYYLLSDLLNPTNNPYPMAAKAHEWVLKAWAILSEPSVKTLVDRELRMEAKGDKNGETFWTRCPNCSYIYEYEKKYKERFLRCQNVKCRGTFKGEPLLDSATPPAEVVNRDVYICYGFAPAGRGRERDPGRVGWRWWASQNLSARSRGKAGEEGLKNEKSDDFFVRISDNGKRDDKDGGCSGVVNNEGAKVDSVEEDNNCGEKIVKKRKKMMARTNKKVAGRGIRVNMNGMEESDNDRSLEVKGGGDGLKDGRCSGVVNNEEVKVDSVEKDNNCGEKIVKKRKKMMARTSKKVAGRGIRVNMNEIVMEESDNDRILEVKGRGDGKDFGSDGAVMGKGSF